MSPEALALILPDAFNKMSFPSTTIVPSFFMTIFELPHVKVMSSAASIDKLLPDFVTKFFLCRCQAALCDLQHEAATNIGGVVRGDFGNARSTDIGCLR